MQKRILGRTFHLKDTMCLGYSEGILGCDGCPGDGRAVSFVTRSILDATSIYRCTAVLRWQLHTRSHFTILGQGSVSGDTVCRVHRAPSSEGGAGSTKRRCDLSAPSPGGPALSARVRSLLAACPSWRTRFSAPRMHLLAPRALGAKLHALLTSLRRRRRSPPHQPVCAAGSGASSRLRAWACA